MLNIKIYPRKLKGKIVPPPSKSILHRCIICASLSKGISIIKNVSFSDDIVATIKAMETLGASIIRQKDQIIVKGIDIDNNNNNGDNIVINCNESGSTIRFLLPIITLFKGNFEIKTEGNLINRPLNIYYEIFDREGINYVKDGKSIFIQSEKKISSGKYKIKGDISSQFITGLLFVLPLLDSDSEIEIYGELQSKSYVDLTINVMENFGVYVDNKDYKSFKIKGGQRYTPTEFKVETDYSQAAFFIVARALGNDLEVQSLNRYTNQGDGKIVEIVDIFEKKMNDFRKNKSSREDIIIDGSQIPDIVPIISLMMSFYDGITIIKDVGRLMIKESNRLKAIVIELNSLGVDIKVEEENSKYNLKINGKNSILDGGLELSSHLDHRIAMMLAISATMCKSPIIINNAECVSKSYPDFWKEYERLGGVIDVCNMGKKL